MLKKPDTHGWQVDGSGNVPPKSLLAVVEKGGVQLGVYFSLFLFCFKCFILWVRLSKEGWFLLTTPKC